MAAEETYDDPSKQDEDTTEIEDKEKLSKTKYFAISMMLITLPVSL